MCVLVCHSTGNIKCVPLQEYVINWYLLILSKAPKKEKSKTTNELRKNDRKCDIVENTRFCFFVILKLMVIKTLNIHTN